MTKRLKWSITTIALLVLAVFFLWMGMTSMRNTSASAAENDAAATEASTDGWYITGQGAGSLRNCNWSLQDDFKLTGTALDSENYLGLWTTGTLTLYESTRLEFQYSGDISTVYPNAPIVANYENLITSGAYESFADYLNANIEVRESGEYQFTLYVAQGQSGIVVSLQAYLMSKDVLDITLYRMSIVGGIAYNPSMHWGVPYGASPVGGITMEFDSATNIWSSPAIYLTTQDEFKVYNRASGLYYPGLVENNMKVTVNGWYQILWAKGSQAPFVVQTTEPVTPAPVYETGWFMVGNGAGVLRDCNWDVFLPNLRFDGIQSGQSMYEDYYGTWTLDNVLMYQGDQFKILYNDGTLETPDDSDWASYDSAGFNKIDSTEYDVFGSAGMYNLEMKASGYYNIRIVVSYSNTTGANIVVTADLVSSAVPPISTFEMYIVGYIESVPSCNWPVNVSNVATSCIPMGYNAERDTWRSPRIYLETTDEFKVYNDANHSYYPSGAKDNISVEEAGYYIIEWSFSNAQKVNIIPA